MRAMKVWITGLWSTCPIILDGVIVKIIDIIKVTKVISVTCDQVTDKLLMSAFDPKLPLAARQLSAHPGRPLVRLR